MALRELQSHLLTIGVFGYNQKRSGKTTARPQMYSVFSEHELGRLFDLTAFR
jgi:hypothetical protein